MSAVATLEQEIVTLKSALNQKDQRIAQLEELIRLYKHRQFGASSEHSPDQIALFDEAASEADNEVASSDNTLSVPARTRKKRRVSIPADFPREDIIHDLPEAQKVCPYDATPLQQIGHETHEQLNIIPAKITCLRHIRLKYGCPCCAQYVVTASKPNQPIKKSIAAPGLLAHIAVSKYADALPLYRQTTIFQHIGVELDRTTLGNWMIRCGHLIQPLINRFHDQLMDQRLIHMDETPVQVLN